MIRISFLAVVAACSVAATSRAETHIYKCTDDAGNVAYLQLPCPAKPAAPAAEYSEPAPVQSSREPAEPLADCKKRYRDQIDAVEAELFTTDVATMGETYKERLLALAQQLRACD